MREEEIKKLRGAVRDCVSKHLYSTATVFAEIVAAATADPADIYMQAQGLYLRTHYHRAFHLLNASQIVLSDLRFRYLAAKCLEQLKDWNQCLLMLGDAKMDEHGNVTDTKDCNIIYVEDGEINALECLIEGHMLSCEEETNLLATLQFGPEDGWLSSFYSCLVKKNEKENVVEAKFRELEVEVFNTKRPGKSLCALKNNTHLLACKAEYYYQCGEYRKCFGLTSMLLDRDPFHLKCTLVHLAAAVELGHSNELYLMASNLATGPQK